MQYRTDPITIKGAAVLPTADSTTPPPTRTAAEFHRPIVRDHTWRSVATTALLVMGVHDSLRIAKQYFFPHLSMWQPTAPRLCSPPEQRYGSIALRRGESELRTRLRPSSKMRLTPWSPPTSARGSSPGSARPSPRDATRISISPS